MAPDGEAARVDDRVGPHVMDESLGEPRWPPLAALVIFLALNIAARIYIPNESVAHVTWLVPAIEVVLLVVLLTSNPTGAAERRRLHRVSIAIVGLLVVAALWATVILIHDLIEGSGVSQDPSELLAAGAEVWLGNIFAFSMLYWLLDGGGPLARSRRSGPVDFAFTQHMSPELARPGLATGVPRLPPPRLHERDGLQPDRRDAADAAREVHDGRSVDRRARPVRARGGARGERLHLGAGS